MRAFYFGLMALAVGAAYLLYAQGGFHARPRARPPIAEADRAPAATAAPHRGGAAHSVRGALADSATTRGTTTRGAAAPLADRSVARDVDTPETNAAATALSSAPSHAADATAAPVASIEKTPAPDAGTGADGHAASPARMPPPAAAAARTAPAAPTAAAPPKPAAELFGPFVGDDPSQVFAPASATYHAAVQGETVDPDWGPAASDALRRYITDLFGARFEIPLADCRQDLCELQIANRPGSDSEADICDLSAAMGRLTQQPWWNALGFDQQNGLTSYVPDGRVIALWFFSRR